MRNLEAMYLQWSSPAEKSRAVEAAAKRKLHPALPDLLRAMNSSFAPSPKREEHLAALSQPGTVVVVTGQQLGLFGGPLMTFYKMATAIRVAQEIRKQHKIPAVPVFWAQSEDQDYEEIRSGLFPSPRSSTVSVSLEPRPENRISLAHVKIGSEIENAVAVFDEQLKTFPDATPVIDLLRESYRAGGSLEEAFCRTWASIFAAEGLVFFRPRFPGVAPAMLPIFERTLKDYRAIGEILAKQAEQIRKRGEKEQVHVRQDSPLFFFHPDGAEGPRFRIESGDGSQWNLIGSDSPKTFSREEMLTKISNSPECFSASALLRPILQDSLFPTAAYVGGEAEQRYFEQIVPLFEFFSLPPPCVCPRARFLLIEPKANRLLEELHLEPADALKPEKEFLTAVLSKNSEVSRPPEFLRNLSKELLGELFLNVREAIEEVDRTLLSPLEKTEEKFTQQLDSLFERYTKALASREQLTSGRAHSLRELLLPSGEEQERTFLAVYFIARYGDAFRNSVMEAIKPGLADVRTLIL